MSNSDSDHREQPADDPENRINETMNETDSSNGDAECAQCALDLTDPATSGYRTDHDEWVCSRYCEHMQEVAHGAI